MIKQELIDYVHRQFQHGHDITTIKEHLITNGYIPEIAEEAIKCAKHHKNAKEHHGKKQMHISFSAPSIAFLFVCVALFGMSIYWGAQSIFTTDLAGAVAEPIRDLSQVEETVEVDAVIPTIDEDKEIPTIENQNIQSTSTEEQITTEPKEAVTQSITMVDNDRDGLFDAQEKELGTDRLDQDSDDDGFFDGDEVGKGTDPLNFYDPGVVYCATVKDCKQSEGCNENGICVACIDSDALNYKVKGTTSGVHYTNNKAMISTDNCAEGSLLEFYCRNDGYLFYQKVNCAMEFGEGYYCSEGRCMR